jgi:hypothetical protein
VADCGAGSAALALCVLLAATPAAAQDEPAGAAVTRQPEAAEESAPRYEAEFVASTIFQGGTVAVGLRSPLRFEGHFFGVETNEIGTVGLAWTFSRGRLRLVPGAAWLFGTENRPMPVVTARWSYERGRWFTQGMWLQSFRGYVVPPEAEGETESGEADASVRYASTLDGVHVSVRLGQLELGPLIEHILYRESNEWKGGVRATWRAAGEFRLVGQVLGPGLEARAGFSWER